MTDATQENPPINTPPAQLPQENTPTETPEQINWKKFREEKEKERLARAEAERQAQLKAQEAEALKAALEAALNKPSPNYSSDDVEETEDQRIEKKVKAALEQREKEYQEERLRQEKATFLSRLKQEYRDFDQVCSAENLDYLDYHYPEVTAPFQYMPEGYEKWAAAYKAVKKLVMTPASQKDQAKAEKNFNKPQSMSVGGAAQTGDSAPMYLDDKRKADNWKRMQERMRKVT